jgi:hypothetical protein
MYVSLFIVGILCLLYWLWVHYLAIMNLQRVRDAGKLTNAARIFGTIVALFGKALNIFLNFTLFSLVVWDLPRELMITSHLNRILLDTTAPAWKRSLCTWICTQLLDAFDPTGAHCACQEADNDEERKSA